jgi:hypothetical protein
MAENNEEEDFDFEDQIEFEENEENNEEEEDDFSSEKK